MSWPLRESLCRSLTPAAFDESTVRVVPFSVAKVAHQPKQWVNRSSKPNR
jgi:hypothetical protein